MLMKKGISFKKRYTAADNSQLMEEKSQPTNNVPYIIVQAGGRGSRLETLTTNKPKALVPVDNRPMIFHLFERYPQAKFLIIADYQKETFKRYLAAFCEADYEMIDAAHKGTCSGIAEALQRIPSGVPLMLIWCDLILSDVTRVPETVESNYLGISKDFPCRWSYRDGQFIEEASAENGVAGMFIFRDKEQIADVPQEGEFVRYLAGKGLPFRRLNMYGGVEVGTMLFYFQNELNRPKCRSFNKVDFKGDVVIKYPVNEQGKKLAVDESNWYRKAKELGYENIPQIYGYAPLVMEKVRGKNVYEYAFLTHGVKRALLVKIVDALKQLHALAPAIPANQADCENNYITKTFDRLAKVQQLVPFAQEEWVTINGRRCRNIYAIKDEVVEQMRRMFPSEFHIIHGDCTFHNILLETGEVRPVLIDPRGYFGKTALFGDADYDWAKLYYSVVGDYDQFNRKNFSLEIREEDVELEIVSNGWGGLEEDFFELCGADRRKIKLLHAIIWLSLTTYAWEDYDAICGAFYKGLRELQSYLDEQRA